MQVGVAESVHTEQGVEVLEEPTPEFGSASGALHQPACRSSHAFRLLSKGMLVCAPINADGTGNEARDTSERALEGLGIFGDTLGSGPFGFSPLPSLV
jgi:hypothetical protein